MNDDPSHIADGELLVIAGPIGDGRYQGLPARIAALKGKMVYLYVNSEGGNVATGLAIHAALARHGQAVALIRRAESAAVVAVLGSHSRLIAEDGRIALHNPKWVNRWCFEGDGIEAAAASVRSLRNDLVNLVAVATHQFIDLVDAWFDEEAAFTGIEALSAGFAHAVVDLRREVNEPESCDRHVHFPNLAFASEWSPDGSRIPVGSTVHHRGRIFVAVRDVIAAKSKAPGQDGRYWQEVDA